MFPHHHALLEEACAGGHPVLWEKTSTTHTASCPQDITQAVAQPESWCKACALEIIEALTSVPLLRGAWDAVDLEASLHDYHQCPHESLVSHYYMLTHLQKNLLETGNARWDNLVARAERARRTILDQVAAPLDTTLQEHISAFGFSDGWDATPTLVWACQNPAYATLVEGHLQHQELRAGTETSGMRTTLTRVQRSIALFWMQTQSEGVLGMLTETLDPQVQEILLGVLAPTPTTTHPQDELTASLQAAQLLVEENR